MAEPVKGFQTNEGTRQYDYNALANKPTLITQDQVDAALNAAKEYTDEKIKNIDVNVGEEYVTDQELQGAITSALTQAKENGDFKGEPGDDYVLTEADKNEIAAIAADLIDIPESDGGNAEDGFSPIATVTQTASGAVVSITDKNGTTTATITNGKDGKDGADGQPGKDGYIPQKGIDYFDGQDGQDGSPGKDGVSPTVEVKKTGKVTTITITDVNGTKTATIHDGEDGTSSGGNTVPIYYTSKEPSDDWDTFLFDYSEIETNGKTINVGDWIVTPSGKVYVVAFVEDYGIDATYDKNLSVEPCVKTVNGVAPDANGNVEVSVSGENIDLSDYLQKSELEEAVNDALTQAKESGEFDGEDGQTPMVTITEIIEAESDNSGIKVRSGVQIDIADEKGTKTAKIMDGLDGEDGVSPTVEVKKTGKVTTITITDVNGTKTATIHDGENGQRGTGLLSVTTEPSIYGIAVSGIPMQYRMAISTIKTQAGVSEVLPGDTIRYNYYQYPIDYLDASYAYCSTRISVQGESGTSVTVESVTESTEDGGSNVVAFSDGKTLTVKNGSKGSTGAKGETGPAGPAYTLTEDDIAGMIEEVKANLPAYIPAVLTSEFYGDELPAAGTRGRIFFKKVI